MSLYHLTVRGKDDDVIGIAGISHMGVMEKLVHGLQLDIGQER